MTRYVAFLRAINVGGHVVKSDALKSVFASLKLEKVETFLASGNVIFNTPRKDAKALAAEIAAALEKRLGYAVETFLRTDAEVPAVASCVPFSADAVAEAPTFCIGFMSAKVTAEAEAKVRRLLPEGDELVLRGTEYYWLGRQKQSESKFSAAVFEKAAGMKVTMRGRGTLQKLAAKYPPRLD